MGRADRARRERLSRRLEFRPRRPAGPATPASSFACRLLRRLRLAPAAGLLCASLALALAGLPAAPAQAQTDVTLVSNMNEAVTAVIVLRPAFIIEAGDSSRLDDDGAPFIYDHAQQFRTGSAPLGYAISELDLHFVPPTPSQNTANTHVYTDGVTVSVRSVLVDADNTYTWPGAEIFTFRSPYPLRDGVMTFTAPANAPVLAKDTDYFIVVEATGPFASNSYMEMYTTLSHSENGLTGWNIANSLNFMQTRFEWMYEVGEQTEILKMALRGREFTPPLSTDATLSALGLTDNSSTPIALTPTFASTTKRYTATVASNIDKATIAATASDADDARVDYLDANDAAIPDADANATGHQVALSAGANVIKVKVTAEDGVTTQTWRVVVTRQDPSDASLSALSLTDGTGADVPLAPAFSPAKLDYTAFVGTANQITIGLTVNDPHANGIEFLDKNGNAIDDVDGDSANGLQVALSADETDIKVKVTANDGTVRTYTVTVTRYVSASFAAKLEAAPAFDRPYRARRHFDLLLSEPVWSTPEDMRARVFQVTNGWIESAEPVTGTPGQQGTTSAHWRLAVQPVRALEKITVKIPEISPSAACAHPGILCIPGDPNDSNSEDKFLTNAPSLDFEAVGTSAPTGVDLKLEVRDANVTEDRGRAELIIGLQDEDDNYISIPTGLSGLRLRMRTVAGGTAAEGVDYVAADHEIIIPPGEDAWAVDLFNLIPDSVDDPNETVFVEISEAWTLYHGGLRVEQITIENRNFAGDTVQETGDTVQATVTILAPQGVSQSARGTITLNAPDTTSRPGTAGFKVVRSGANVGDEVCFVFETIDEGTGKGTADPGDDYHPKLWPVWMQADENQRTLWLQAKRDDENDANETVNVQIRDARYCNDPRRPVNITTATRTWTLVEPPSAQAKFFAPPVHDGKTKFAMQFALSDPVRNTRDEMQDHVVKVRGGQLGSVEPVNGQTDLWEVTVDPDGTGNVTVSVEGKANCTDPGALCTEDGEPFEETVTATVRGPDGPAPLTASFEDAPVTHDGMNAFTVDIVFSEAPAAMDNQAIGAALQIDGGTKRQVRMVDGDPARRAILIKANGVGPVTLSFEATADCADAHALCTAAGGRLETAVEVTVKGPPVLSVSNARAEEGPGATLDFVVSLSHAYGARIKAPYQVEDGTAIEGEDYTKPGGQGQYVVFAPGETEKTLSIAVLEDELDEGIETMKLWAVALETINAQGERMVLTHGTGTIVDPGAEATASPLTASFEQVPAGHDGTSRFNLDIVFSEAPAGMKNEDIRAVVQATNARKLGMSRLNNVDDAHRNMRFDPLGNGDITITIPATTDCTAAGALCTAAGGKLETGISVTIPGPAATAPPLTASFEQVPEEHDGTSRFNLDIVFSEAPAGMKNEEIRAVVQATNALKRGMSRLNNVDDAHRNMRFDPLGNGEITISIPATTDCAAAGALCTAAGGKLETGIGVTIPGPVAIGVADASVEEAADAVLAFEVSLDRARHDTVTVDYATENGTATAGEDYTATSGTLTFAAGETTKTVSVPVLDDALDEGEETFVLRLSNAQGARIGDGEATGTIVNSDPLQKMWLSRFGRTVASHVTEAVSDRLAGPLTGAQVTVGGQAVNLARTGDAAWLGQTLTSVARALGAPAGPEGDGRAGSGTGGWPGTGPGIGRSPAANGAPARDISGRELLLGSAFHVARGGDGTGPGLAVWGRVATGGFDGEAPADGGTVRIGGTVTTGILGTDAEWDRLLGGVAISVSEGEGSFDQPDVDSGTIESTMTTVSPYARVMLTDRVSAWGLAGWGTGDMTIVQDARAATDTQPERAKMVTRTDLEMRLAAVGGRGALLTQDEAGGLDLALKADAFFVETEAEEVSNEGNTTAGASRVRLVLEGGRAFAMGGGATLRPSLELGLRHDGGDAEIGTGVELGGGVAYTDPATGLSVDARARMLVAHADSDYEEWGVSGAVRFAPGERGRGLSLSLSPALGATSSAAERLWGARDAGGLAPGGEFAAARGLQGELGYGLSLFGDRFTGTPNVGFGLSDSARDYRIGWRLTSAIGGDPGFEVNLDATRKEAANGNEPAEHGIGFRLTARW